MFCKIIVGDVPCHKVYEDDRAVAFLDVGPVSEGHTLIVPKAHAGNLREGSKEDAMHLMGVIYEIAPKIMEAVGATGYNLGMNHGVSAGQDVMHIHLHIMPRKAGEPRDFVKTHPSNEELLAVASNIRATMR